MVALLEVVRFVVIPSAMIAIYFGFLKVGHKVGASYSFRHSRTEASGISEVILTNFKDRSTPIFALYAVKDAVIIQLIQFDQPVVLKSFDSIKVEIPPVSEYLVDGEPFKFTDLSISGFTKTDIYYSTIGKLNQCVPISPPSHLSTGLLKREKLKLATVTRHTFNERVYSSSVIYIIEYKMNGTFGVAFVDAGGFIDWGLGPNGIPGTILDNPQAIADTLLSQMPFIERLIIRKTYGWKRQFCSNEPFKPGTDDIPVIGNRNAETLKS